MLTFEELLTEVRQRSVKEQLTLLEELAQALRQELGNSTSPETEVAQPDLSPEALGWPPGYFEQTYGSLSNEPLERAPQGEYEVREKLQ